MRLVHVTLNKSLYQMLFVKMKSMYLRWYLLLMANIACCAVGQNLTADSPIGDCFRQNALKMVGSECFAKRYNTFGRRRKEKRAAFVKYITDKCEVPVPFEYEDTFASAVNKMETISGDWVKVTGIAKIGDLVIDHKRLMFVTDTGRRTIKLYQGKQIAKKTDLWHFIKQNTPDDWETFPQFTNASKIVDPSAPDGECAPYTWQQGQAGTRKRLFWTVARINRRVVRIPNTYKATATTVVYRYIDASLDQASMTETVAEVTTIRDTTGAASSTPPVTNAVALLAMYLHPEQADTLIDTPKSVDTTIAFTPQFDLANMYDTATGTLTMEAGLYFGGLYACLPKLKLNAVYMRGGLDNIGIEFGKASQTLTIAGHHGRNFLVDFAQGSNVDVTYQGLLCSQNTFIFLLPLETIFSPLVAFSVAADNAGPLSLNHVLYNNQAAWGNNKFTAPSDGLYYFTVSGAIPAFTKHSMSLLVNGVTTMTQMHTGRMPTSAISLSSGCLLDLAAGDEVTLTSMYNVFSDAEKLQTSLAGFLYSPVSTRIAWSIGAKRDNYYPIIFELLSIIPEFPPTNRFDENVYFDTVYVDTDSVWNYRTVFIPVTGYYFLQLQITLMNLTRVDVGITNTYSSLDKTQLPRIVADNARECFRPTSSGGIISPLVIGTWVPCFPKPFDDVTSGNSTFSSSNVVYLQQGDSLRVKVYNLNEGAYIIGGTTRQTTFTGMLMHV